MKKIVIAIAAIAISAFVACEKENSTSTANYDRKALLENMANQVIVPAFEQFDVQAQTLLQASAAFDSTPNNTTLESLKQAYKSAYLSYQKISAFEFGPADEQQLAANLNVFPTDTNIILSNSTKATVDLNLPSNYSAKGFPALDFLLYSTSTHLAFYTDASNGKLRRNYIKLLAQQIAAKANTVNTAWKTSYSATFTQNTGTATGSSVSLLVNQLNSLFSKLYLRYWL